MLWSRGMRNRLTDNLTTARLTGRVSLREVAESVGQLAVETAALWKTPDELALSRVRRVEGWDEVLALRAGGRGLIFLTPHLATFEIASLFIGAEMPMTVMFRAPRVAWAEPMMRAGRDRLQIKSVPADISGIRAMLRALRRGEPIGLLPDQVPTRGDGLWAPFFGRPAYTMSLVKKFSKTTGGAPVMVACKRLPEGQGYALKFDVLAPFSDASEIAGAELNAAVERAIEFAPAQYLWTYNRYKVPADVADPSPSTIVL